MGSTIARRVPTCAAAPNPFTIGRRFDARATPTIRRPDPAGAQEPDMTKGMDRKKETKKKPAKTMKEKKAEKTAKKSAR